MPPSPPPPQLRLAVAIPVQLACTLALYSALPLPCGLPAVLGGGFSSTAGCMPLSLAARLAVLGVLLPIIALYLLEGRSRAKWAADRSAAP